MTVDPGFTKSDAPRLSDRLLVLYAAQDVRQFMSAGVELVRPFIDADSLAVAVCDPRQDRVLALGWPNGADLARYGERMVELAYQSPMFQHWSRTGDHDRVLRRTDCCDDRAYRATALYHEVSRPLGQNRHLGTWCRLGNGHHIEIGLGREGRLDFEPQDLARLSVLRAHVARAYRNILERSQWQSQARAPTKTDVPVGVCKLQKTSLSSHIDLESPAVAVVDPRGRAPSPSSLRPSRELTPREREVLGWVVQGKTNQEIGIILGTSWRTVRNHLEHVFAKLGVESRTAAAVRAIELGWAS